MRLLFKSFVLKKKIKLFVYLLLNWRSSIYILNTSPMTDRCFEVCGFNLQEVRRDREPWGIQTVHAEVGDPSGWRVMHPHLPSASQPMAG